MSIISSKLEAALLLCETCNINIDTALHKNDVDHTNFPPSVQGTHLPDNSITCKELFEIFNNEITLMESNIHWQHFQVPLF